MTCRNTARSIVWSIVVTVLEWSNFSLTGTTMNDRSAATRLRSRIPGLLSAPRGFGPLRQRRQQRVTLQSSGKRQDGVGVMMTLGALSCTRLVAS